MDMGPGSPCRVMGPKLGSPRRRRHPMLAHFGREEGSLERSIGSMGSEYTRFRFPPDEIPMLAKLDWTAIARRVFIDPASGLIALMSPSSKHERYAWATGRLMDAVARGAGLSVISLGATRWRRPEDPVNTGAEPGACYYLGRRADRWVEARGRLDETALEAFEFRMPPDLVIEVERSRDDADKPDFYRRLGAREMWRLDIAGNRREAIMLDLQAADGPAQLHSSAVIPPAGPAFVLDALELAADNRLAELDALIAARLADGGGGQPG